MIVRMQVRYPVANEHLLSFLLKLRQFPDPSLLSHNVCVARARLLEYLNLPHKYQTNAPREHLVLLMRSQLYLHDREAVFLICSCR